MRRPVCPTSTLLFLEQVSLIILGPFCILLYSFSPPHPYSPPKHIISSLAPPLSPLCHLSLSAYPSHLFLVSYPCPTALTLSFILYPLLSFLFSLLLPLTLLPASLPFLPSPFPPLSLLLSSSSSSSFPYFPVTITYNSVSS